MRVNSSVKNSLLTVASVVGLSSLESKVQGQTPDFPSTGLVRYYNFDEGTGIFAGDATGNHSLIVSNSWTPDGKINGAYNPNGISYNTGFGPLGQTGMSVNFWMKRTANWGPYTEVVGTGSTGGNFYIDTWNNQSLLFFLAPGVAPNVSFPNDGNYHMVTLSMANGEQRAYIDGAQEFVTSLPYSFSGNSVRFFGGLGGNASNNILHMDEVGIWDRPLNTTEISALYNQGHALPFPSPASVGLGLVASGLALSRKRSN